MNDFLKQGSVKILDQVSTYHSEGIDYSSEKVFETPHPYPRGEFKLDRTYQNPSAVAYILEIDKRSQTEFNNEFLQVSSMDHAFWINDNFGTHTRFS